MTTAARSRSDGTRPTTRAMTHATAGAVAAEGAGAEGAAAEAAEQSRTACKRRESQSSTWRRSASCWSATGRAACNTSGYPFHRLFFHFNSPVFARKKCAAKSNATTTTIRLITRVLVRLITRVQLLQRIFDRFATVGPGLLRKLSGHNQQQQGPGCHQQQFAKIAEYDEQVAGRPPSQFPGLEGGRQRNQTTPQPSQLAQEQRQLVHGPVGRDAAGVAPTAGQAGPYQRHPDGLRPRRFTEAISASRC